MKRYLLFIFLLTAAGLVKAQTDAINIKTTGLLVDYQGNTAIDASALLQLNSDATATQGFLAPRMALSNTTTAAPVTTPANGLLVFNTNTAGDVAPGFYYWDNNAAKWIRIISGTGSFPTGSGTTDYVARWTPDGNTLGTSTISDNGTKIGIGTTPHATYMAQVAGDILLTSGWLRTTGTTGFTNETYGGGIYMQDATWIRTSGNKSFYHNTGNFRTDGTLQVGASGATLNVPSGGNFAYKSNVIFGQYASGNVGIGTTTPAYTFEVNGNGAFTAIHKIGPYVANPENGMWNPLFTAIAAGKPIYNDEEFASGSNSVNVYNNSGGTGVVHTREAGDGSQPNSSGYWIKIVNDGVGATSPGLGGFYQTISARRNATFVQRFRAKLPVGYSLVIAENAQGTNNNSYWLTPTAGTGKWEEYIRVSHCGNTGTFSSGGHVYVTGSPAAFTWYLASCNVYEVGTPGTGSSNGTYILNQTTVQPSSNFNISGNGIVGGNMGIGVTPSGTYKLQVNGKLLTSGIDENSDIRLKKDITPITDALHKVMEMRGVTYHWIKPEMEKDLQFGLIAQELEKVIPELVTTDGDGYKAIEYSHLVPVLIEAIKELKTENNSLKSDIQSLKSENKVLNTNYSVLSTRLSALENKVEVTTNKAEK